MGDRPGIAGTLYLVAQLALATGNNATARALFADGATLEGEMHRHGPHVALFLFGEGIAAQRAGDAEAAHATFTRSLTLFQQLGDQGYAARLHHILLSLLTANP